MTLVSQSPKLFINKEADIMLYKKKLLTALFFQNNYCSCVTGHHALPRFLVIYAGSGKYF